MPLCVYTSKEQISRSMKNLKRRDLARRLCSRNWLAGMAVAVLSLVSAGLTGCGGSQSEVSGVVSPTAEEAAQAGLTIEDAPSQTPAPTPSELPSPTASPIATVAPTADVPPTTQPTASVVPTVAPPPHVTAVPTVAPRPTEVASPEDTAVPIETEFVFESSDIPPELEALILGRNYVPILKFTSGSSSNGEVSLQKMLCNDPNTGVYVESLISQYKDDSSEFSEMIFSEEIGVYSWLFPWQDGFLYLGYPKVARPCTFEASSESSSWTAYWFPSLHEVTHLLMQSSNDGVHWTDPIRFSIPLEIPNLVPSGGQIGYSPLELDSDGQNLIIAWTESENVSVAITSDLVEWTTREVPLLRPPDLNEKLQTFTGLFDVAVNPSGWVIGTNTGARIVFSMLIPDDIKTSATEFLSDPFDFSDEGLTFRWSTEDSEEEIRLVSWEELGIDKATYARHGNDLWSNKPYMQAGQFYGWAMSALWESDSSDSDEVSWSKISVGKCCVIVGTRSGYMAAAPSYTPGYSPYRYGWIPGMFFSSDGSVWDRIESPISYLEDKSMWIFSDMFSIGDGVIVVGTACGPCEFDEETERVAWFGASDGSAWQELRLSDYAYVADWLDGGGRFVTNGDLSLCFRNGGFHDCRVAPQ